MSFAGRHAQPADIICKRRAMRFASGPREPFQRLYKTLQHQDHGNEDGDREQQIEDSP